MDVARHWDEAEGRAERRAMLVDAVGTDHVRVLPAIPGTRVHVFNPDRIVLVPADSAACPARRVKRCLPRRTTRGCLRRSGIPGQRRPLGADCPPSPQPFPLGGREVRVAELILILSFPLLVGLVVIVRA